MPFKVPCSTLKDFYVLCNQNPFRNLTTINYPMGVYITTGFKKMKNTVISKCYLHLGLLFSEVFKAFYPVNIVLALFLKHNTVFHKKSSKTHRTPFQKEPGASLRTKHNVTLFSHPKPSILSMWTYQQRSGFGAQKLAAFKQMHTLNIYHKSLHAMCDINKLVWWNLHHSHLFLVFSLSTFSGSDSDLVLNVASSYGNW